MSFTNLILQDTARNATTTNDTPSKQVVAAADSMATKITGNHHGYGNTISTIMYTISIVPMVLLTWIQFLLNIGILCGIAYGVWNLVSILSVDLDKHLDKKAHLMLVEIVQCSREYVRNGCGQIAIAPALEKVCDSWKLCMERDTNEIMKSTETAVMMAEILNRFFDSLSNRTIYCSASFLGGSIVFANLLLNWARMRTTWRKN